MPVNRSRVAKRVHYACENCRKKKTRCPGERPACSNCARLSQACRYNNAAAGPARPAGQETGKSLEGRLAQLEERMELMLERGMYVCLLELPYLSQRWQFMNRGRLSFQSQEGPDYTETEESNSHQFSDNERISPPFPQHRHITPRGQGYQPAVCDSANGSQPLPPRAIILEIIELYFQFCHRQPLWLFDREELSSIDEMAEELIFALLALTIRFSTTTYFEGRSHQELSQRYGEVARGHIMFRIAQGAVQMSTTQSLCLLAFANFTAQETHLAWLHINLATSLANLADMNFEIEKGLTNSATESRRKVFYSIYLLNQTYAQRSMLLNMLDDIENPKYLEPKRDLKQESGQLPPLTPQDSSNITQVDKAERAGIWTYMIQQSSLWREVRGYVAQCADGNQKPPWSPESGYAVIGAHLMDLETRFPTYHRYDAVKFLDRSTAELQQNLGYWSPWLCIQFVYHAIHSMLNHPFLYSSRPNQSMQIPVPNTFWKTSSELALLHSTWTVRLIDMVWEKDYRVSDPFLGHCAAIAATIHLYYCRATDIRVRTSAQSKLGKCMRFIDELGTVWPVCQLIYDRLDSLVQSALGSKSQKEGESLTQRTVSINTGLMWDILDYTCPKTAWPAKDGRGLFDSTFIQDKSPTQIRGMGRDRHDGSGEDDEQDDDVVETQIFHHPNPATEVDTSHGGQEFPPYSGAAVRRSRSQNNVNQHDSTHTERIAHSAPAHERLFVGQQREQQEADALITWPADDMWMSASIMDVSNDPFFQFQGPDMPWTGSWEIGNL